MSLLDVIRIAEPCTESWSSMTGDERARHCGTCDKTVFDLSVLTRAEAEALLAAKGANMCGRYRERSDGTIVMADCLVKRKHRRISTMAVVAAAALVGGAILHEDSPEPLAIDVTLPDDSEATLPVRQVGTERDNDEQLERQRAIEELGKALELRQFKAGGEMMGGAISFDHVDLEPAFPTTVDKL